MDAPVPPKQQVILEVTKAATLRCAPSRTIEQIVEVPVPLAQVQIVEVPAGGVPADGPRCGADKR